MKKGKPKVKIWESKSFFFCKKKKIKSTSTGILVDASWSLQLPRFYKFLPELIWKGEKIKMKGKSLIFQKLTFLNPWNPPVPRIAFMSSSLALNPLGATRPFLDAMAGAVFLSLGAWGISYDLRAPLFNASSEGGGGGGGIGAGGNFATCPTSISGAPAGVFFNRLFPAINWASNAFRIESWVGSCTGFFGTIWLVSFAGLDLKKNC